MQYALRSVGNERSRLSYADSQNSDQTQRADASCRKCTAIVLVFLSHRSITVNSEIFAKVLFSRNFAYAKFREYKVLAKCRNQSVIY